MNENVSSKIHRRCERGAAALQTMVRRCKNTKSRIITLVGVTLNTFELWTFFHSSLSHTCAARPSKSHHISHVRATLYRLSRAISSRNFFGSPSYCSTNFWSHFYPPTPKKFQMAFTTSAAIFARSLFDVAIFFRGKKQQTFMKFSSSPPDDSTVCNRRCWKKTKREMRRRELKCQGWERNQKCIELFSYTIFPCVDSCPHSSVSFRPFRQFFCGKFNFPFRRFSFSVSSSSRYVCLAEEKEK